MLEFNVPVVNKVGLHTRPSATLVKMASKYESEFYISKDGMRVNGKSIIGVMSLNSPPGTILNLEFDGPDEAQMAEEIVAYFQRGFDEL